mmetsp:Transcript_5033/g.14295  ORF Transcript_5033/g.14295 Transcript_5033/m.14295 type:complete len:98 (-) Transcript_5033:1302-1595(-)
MLESISKSRISVFPVGNASNGRGLHGRAGWMLGGRVLAHVVIIHRRVLILSYILMLLAPCNCNFTVLLHSNPNSNPNQLHLLLIYNAQSLPHHTGIR